MDNIRNNFFNSIKIVLYHSQIFGLINFNFRENSKFSKLRIVYPTILVLLYTIVFVYSIHFWLTIQIEIVFKTTLCILLPLAEIAADISWICSVIKKKKCVKLITKLAEFDVLLQDTNSVIDYDRH